MHDVEGTGGTAAAASASQPRQGLPAGSALVRSIPSARAPAMTMAMTTAMALATALAPLSPAAADDPPDPAQVQQMIEAMMRAQGASDEAIEAARGSRRALEAQPQFGETVRYRAVGAYSGTPNVVGGGAGFVLADVTDRVEIEFAWDPQQGAPVGTSTFRNFDSTLANPRFAEPGCATPVVKGR